MSNKDYYKILGVAEGAADDSIKAAYRKLAKQFHPDTNPGNKAAEERFKEISEAYYVLSDKKRRAEYDAFRRGGFSGGGFQGAQGFNFEEVLRMFRGAQGGSAGRGGFRYAAGGPSTGAFGSIFEDLFGGASAYSGMHGEEELSSKVSSDASATLKISRSRAEKGGEVSFTTRDGKKITVKIPPGSASGKKLRLARQGRVCPTCDHPGDLILTLHVE